MGIDAEMFVKWRGAPLEETPVRVLSAALCKLFGHENFFLSKGEYGEPHHAISILRGPYEQDGPDIDPLHGEQFLEVHLWTRYYGEGYERGDWQLIRGVAEFLEIALPGCEVWYGGDSSGVLAELLDQAKREEITAYFYRQGHENYRGAFGRAHGTLCLFCGGIPMHNSGGGRDRVFLSCDGCGRKVIKTARGEWELAKDQDFFGWTEPNEKQIPALTQGDAE